MKKLLLILPGLALSANMSYAQISVGGNPYSVIYELPENETPEYFAPKLDMATVEAEDEARKVAGELPLYGRLIPLEINVQDDAHWVELANGDGVARFKVTAQDAKGIELFFEDMFLPDGSVMYVYDESGDQMFGGFTSYNNHESGAFTTGQIVGESCIVEYYEPASMRGMGRLNLAQVGHAYRMVPGAAVKAGDCQVDVNCPQEGGGWHAERDAVVRISVVSSAGLGWCTGTVINNTSWDCTPYVLTAWHCSDNSSAANFNNYKFYFRYQRTGCDSGPALVNKIMTGCSKISDSEISNFNDGSDFILLELEDDIPDTYTPFFAGWNISGSVSASGKCIHHPSGDEKKVSTYSSNTQNSTWSGSPAGFHWRVFWSATTNGHGVTEGGSSGSPLFNQNKEVIGTLTGGASFCNSVQPGGQFLPDFYGKMDKHWDDNGTGNNRRLKPYLDPNNTGATSLIGSYDPCGMYSLYTDIQESEQEEFVLFPNPVEDVLNVSFDRTFMATLRVLDVTGREFAQEVITVSGETGVLDVSSLPSGMYFLEVMENGRRVGIKPFMKQH